MARKCERYFAFVLHTLFLYCFVCNVVSAQYRQNRGRDRDRDRDRDRQRDRDRDYFDEDYHPHLDDHHDDEPTNHQSQKAVNPCHPSYHRIINNQPQRSYNYRFGTGSAREQALCDRDLTPGWYRFSSLAGNTIPTSCPGVNYCGTRAPVWMKGTIPTTEEGITKVTGCVSVQGKCCTTQIQMLVRNCSDFIVYHLQPTPACPSAYCAGYEVPCPAGLSSDTGYTPCHFPVDLLETKVSYGLSKDNTQLQFFCDVTLGGHVVPESVALEIEWLVDEETVQSETFGLLQQHKGILKEDKWTIGQVLQCRARARHTTINTFTTMVTSPPFNTGVLVVSPIGLSANEGAEPVFVEFQPTIPITCPKKEKPKKKKKAKKEEEEEEEPEEEPECCITFDISTRGPPSPPRCASGAQFDLVVVNTCSVKVCADEWNSTIRVPVWAVNDGLVGGNSNSPESYSTVYIDVRTGETGNPPRWQDIALPAQEIHITHGDVQERCSADDYITTFDGLVYSNDLEGTFVLYKHDTLPYEVQLHLRRCNQRPLCNCAVAIRFGEVMLAADVCTTGKLKFWSYTQDGNYIEPTKITHLPQIVRIDEGRSFQIQFPTGTRLNIGPNLRFISIQASLPDLEHTSGLCGSFDRRRENDFVTFQQNPACPLSVNVSTCVDFVKSWRLATEQSLFVGVFNGEHDHEEEEGHEDDHKSPGQCSCSSIKKGKGAELRPKSKGSSRFSSYPYEDFQPEEAQEEENNSEAKCQTSQCVDPRGVDVTLQLLELVLDEDFSSEDEEFGKHIPSTVELRPVFTSFVRNPALALAVVPNGGNWTDDDADVVCRGIIEGMPATKLCRDIAHINVEYHTKACQKEVMHTKSPLWTMDALEQLRWECRDQVFHNLSIWEPQLGRQFGTPPLSIISSLCLNNCTGVGTCEGGSCQCSRGYGGADCSVNLSQPPILTNLNLNGVCDIRKKPCSEILVWGEKFADSPNLKCHFDVYRAQSVKSVPVLSESLTTNAKMLTYQSVICKVPELPVHDAKIASFYIPGEGLDKTRTLMRVRVSYGSESSPSEALDYTIFDSLCWACEHPLRCEPRPTQSCNVLSEPFGTGSDPFIQTNSPIGLYSDPPGGGRGGGDGRGLGAFSHSNSPLQYSPSVLLDVSGYHRHPHQLPGAGVNPISPINNNNHNNNNNPPHLHPQLGNPCFLPKESGPCRNDILRYFFDSTASQCRPFIFSGCGGNSNNFASQQDCLSACTPQPQSPSQQQQPSALTSQLSALTPHPHPSTSTSTFVTSAVSPLLLLGNSSVSHQGAASSSSSSSSPLINLPEKCNQGNNPGPCKEEIVRYYYDTVMGKCRPFIYGNCGGNSNNFQSKADCEQECHRV